MTHWRDEWESHADAEAAKYEQAPVALLLSDIRHARFGDYYTLWSAVARRASLAEAGWLLLDVLRSDAPYLTRYHCADALLKLLRCDEFEAVALSAERFPLARNLAQVRALVEAQIGARGNDV